MASTIDAFANEGPLGLQWPLLIAFVLPGVGLLAVWLIGHLRGAAATKPG